MKDCLQDVELVLTVAHYGGYAFDQAPLGGLLVDALLQLAKPAPAGMSSLMCVCFKS